jgi:hypothetical protein
MRNVFVPQAARILGPDIRDALLCADEATADEDRAEFMRLAIERCELVAQALRKALSSPDNKKTQEFV